MIIAINRGHHLICTITQDSNNITTTAYAARYRRNMVALGHITHPHNTKAKWVGHRHNNSIDSMAIFSTAKLNHIMATMVTTNSTELEGNPHSNMRGMEDLPCNSSNTDITNGIPITMVEEIIISSIRMTCVMHMVVPGRCIEKIMLAISSNQEIIKESMHMFQGVVTAQNLMKVGNTGEGTYKTELTDITSNIPATIRHHALPAKKSRQLEILAALKAA